MKRPIQHTTPPKNALSLVAISNPRKFHRTVLDFNNGICYAPVNMNTQKAVATIKAGDKITIITESHVLICEVISVKARSPVLEIREEQEFER